jgi:FKBP-type peptidyl-prolyl cis-trans isomerase
MKLKSIFVLAAMLAASGILYYFTSQTEPPPPAKPRHFVWDVEMEELTKIAISLPLSQKNEAWVKHKDRYWYFDQPDGEKVNMKRWGGGVPLLLSGPGAERLITENADEKQLEIFGLLEPSMKIDLTLENNKTIQIDVGDSTPDAQGFYVRLRHAKAIYTVHESWYHVMERLVEEPPYPYPDPEEKLKSIDPKEHERIKKEALLERKNREKGDEFRSKYKEETGVVELESGILYRILKKGSGEKTSGNDKLLVNYSGSLIDGIIFDSSKKGEPMELSLGRVIKGWREVLKLMKEGAQWEVVIPPELAYGKYGSGQKIGPNETLVFEIELIEIR